MAKKSFGLKNFFFSFVAVIIAIYVFQNGSNAAETMVAEKGSLENIIEAKGIVVKDEEVYTASSDGNITFHQEEGVKVNEGLLIEDLNTDSNSAEINDQLFQIQAAIDKKNEKSDNLNLSLNVKKIKESTKGNVETLSSEQNTEIIQTSVLNKDYENMYELLGQVNNDIKASSENQFDEYDITKLNDMKINLAESLNTHKIPYYSKRAGILSYKIDGLESLYTFENILNMMPSSTSPAEYSLTDMKQVASVKNGDKLFKIMRNFDYYMAVTLNNDYAKLFEEKKYVKVRVVSDGLSDDIWGYIEKINYGSDQSVLIIYFDDFFNKIYDKRYVDLQLITDTYEGLKIDSKSVTEKDGVTGVYVKDASNIVKFMPVLLLGKNENTAIVSEGSYVSDKQRNTIDINDKKCETIKIYDNVILKPDKVYEGQIVD